MIHHIAFAAGRLRVPIYSLLPVVYRLSILLGFIIATSCVPLFGQPFSSPIAYSKLERRACPAPDPRDGPNQYACSSGLAGKSGGKNCLVGTSYKDGKELPQFSFTACTESCINEKLKPTRPCTNTCAETFGPNVAWRSFGALEPDQRKQLQAQYSELLALVKAEANAAAYKKLGGDEKREQLKKQIIDTVLQQMIPYTVACTDKTGGSPRWSEKIRILKDYAAPPSGNVQAAGLAPMATVAEYSMLQIYEYAFYEKTKTGLIASSPDELAAALIHESIHWIQENHGYGQGKYFALSPMHTAQHMLHEIMAYDRCRINTFYKIVLSQEQFKNLITIGLDGSIARLKELMAKELSEGERIELAKWAWTQDFMRSMMTFYPEEDGGVWGQLCAANKGTGPCGMVSNGPPRR